MPSITGTIGTSPTAALTPFLYMPMDVILTNITTPCILGVQESDDGGNTWTSVTNPSTGQPIVVSSANPVVTVPNNKSATAQFRLNGHPTATPNFSISAMAPISPAFGNG